MASEGWMSAAALSNVRAWHAAALDQVSYPMIVIGALLAHLDALTAPADGEALGRELWKAVPVIIPTAWDEIDELIRDRYRAHALALHSRGVAAGVAKGEAERARLAAMLTRWEAAHGGDGVTPEESHGAVRDELAERNATIARLTAELVEARNVASRVVTEAIAEQAVTRAEDVATARADGARVEREAFGDAAQRLTNGPAPSDTKRAIRAWVEDLCVLREKIADKGGEGGAG